MTEVLLTALLVNTAAAMLLGTLALLAWRRFRKPLIAHALVVVALLKLVTPPMWGPVAFEGGPSATDTTTLRVLDAATLEELRLAAARGASAPSVWQSIDPWTTTLVLWLIGCAVAVTIMLRRHRRFTALLDRLDPAPRFVETLAAPLAHELGLRSTPLLRVADSAIQPFLFALGSAPTIVLPRAAIDELDAKGLRALLAHELAHLRNRDHWTRALELAVAATHWWNPVAHLLRVLLREVEEVRCDARAVATLAASEDRVGPKRYGRALLDATDLLEARARDLGRTAFRAPLGATALSDAATLRRRITALATGALPCRMGSLSRSSLVVAAGSLLPLGFVAAPESADGERDGRVVARSLELDMERDFDVLARVEPGEGSNDHGVRWRIHRRATGHPPHDDTSHEHEHDIEIKIDEEQTRRAAPRRLRGLARIEIAPEHPTARPTDDAFVVEAPDHARMLIAARGLDDSLESLGLLEGIDFEQLVELQALEGLQALKGLEGLEVDVRVHVGQLDDRLANTLVLVARDGGQQLAELLGDGAAELLESVGDVESEFGAAAQNSSHEHHIPMHLLHLQRGEVRSY